MKFSKFPIRVETTLDNLYFNSWTQIRTTSFLWLKFTSRENSMKCPKYTTKVISGLSIFFFRKVDKTIMMDFAILFIENVLKHPPNK